MITIYNSQSIIYIIDILTTHSTRFIMMEFSKSFKKKHDSSPNILWSIHYIFSKSFYSVYLNSLYQPLKKLYYTSKVSYCLFIHSQWFGNFQARSLKSLFSDR